MVVKFIENYDVQVVGQLAAGGCKAWTTVQLKKEAVFIPTGFLCLEQVVMEQDVGTFCYGARTRMLIKGSSAASSYAEVIKSMAAEGKHLIRWNEALAYMQAS